MNKRSRPPRLLEAFLFLGALLLAGGAGGQTINPADYGTITLRLQAETLGLANGASVATWGPLAATGTAQPVFVASDPRFNNRPVVKFDGVNDLMTLGGANLAARTIFAVVTHENASGAGNSIATLLSDSTDNLGLRRNGTTLAYSTPGNVNDFTGSPAGTVRVNDSATSSAYTAGTAHIVMAVAGAQKTYSTFWLGNARSDLSRYWNGSIAEIIIYDGVLTPAGLDRVGWYLQNKYNISGSIYPLPPPAIASFTATAGGLTAKTGVLSTAGAAVTLAWNVTNATSVTIDHGALASTSSGTGAVTVSPTVTTTYTLTAAGAAGTVTQAVTVYLGNSTLPLALNEFLSDSGAGLLDEDSTHQDWIEIYNPNPFAVSANGWRLANGSSAVTATDWVFPNQTLEGGQYLVVFASGKNRAVPGSPLHTDFSLSKDGEYLALKRPDGTVATSYGVYPAQRTDVSYGLSGSAAAWFATPTPGAANGAPASGLVADTSFSVKRGLYTTPQTVAITCPTAGATIRYTTDGSTPTATTGTAYTGPLTVSGLTTLRASAFLTGWLPSNTDTQTYLFVSDVLAQTYATGTAPAGWPIAGSAAVNGQTMRYGLNTTLKAQYDPQLILTALKQIPSVSIVTDQANLTNQTTGIYVNADQKGDAWERPASIEFINPDNTAGFHINAGLRIRGGGSRGDYAAKHSFRLYFRGQYGDSSLKYPLHGAGGTDTFQTLDLRTEENYSWANDTGTENTAVREVFCRDLEGALGQPQTRSRYLHLFLNGQYWGLYMTEERAQEDYGATYFGGSADDYDVIQTSNHPNFTYEVGSGTAAAWQQTWNLARACAANPTNANYFALLGRDANGVRVSSLPVYLDADHLATYMLLHYFTGDGDGPLSNFLSMNEANNWRGFRSRVNGLGFRFFPHDCEHTLLAPSWVSARATNNTTTGSNRSNFTYSNAEWIHEDLASNAEYKLKIADLAQKHLLHNGALMPAPAQALFDARAAQISEAIRADCVRWGTSSTNHTYAQWQARLNAIRSGFFPARNTTVLAQLKTRGFYPAVNPPVFSQYGGQVIAGTSLTLDPASQTGTIYYTTDGSDPRQVGGAVATAAKTYTSGVPLSGVMTVRSRFRDSGGTWSALEEATFSAVPAAGTGQIVISKIHYHPANPSAAESSAGFTADQDFEYVELLNISGSTLDLRGLQLADGVTFSFASAAQPILAAGARVVVASNSAAFALRYGNSAQVAGAFSGHLSNSGESLRLANAAGTIAQFTYGTVAPWPSAADGGGSALVLISPETNPDPGVAANWRASYVAGGKPGAVDLLSVSDWRAARFTAADLSDSGKEATVWGNAADPDGDGFTNFQEFVLGGSPTDPARRPLVVQSGYTDPATSRTYLRLSFSVREGTTGVSILPQATGDLTNWSGTPVQVGAPVSQGDGTWLYLYQDSTPVGPTPGNRRFMRLLLQSN